MRKHTHKVQAFLIATCSMFFVNVIACVSATDYELDANNLEKLIKTINTKYSEVSLALRYRKFDSKGLGSPWRVVIDFEPHAVTGREEKYYSLECLYSQSTWECKELKKLRSVSFKGPGDYVRLEGNIEEGEAIEVLEFIRSKAKSGDDNHPLKDEADRHLSKSDINDVVSIRKLSTYQYILKGDSLACREHIIEVERIDCGLGKCGLKILGNRIIYHM